MITIAPLADELHEVAPELIAPFYTYDALFDGPVDRSSRLMTLILEQGLERGYFIEPARSLFIYYSPTLEDKVKQVFEAEGLRVNVVTRSR